MDLNALGSKGLDFIKKYRYPILVLLIGIFLMVLPGKERETVQTAQPQETTPQQGDLSQDLEQILSQIQGVGKVRVLLSVAAGERYEYQQDEDISTTESGGSSRKDTVIITDENRTQEPLLSQVLPPSYRGAIIVCQGAELPQVKLAVVEAVSRLTGLGADAICVLKMK